MFKDHTFTSFGRLRSIDTSGDLLSLYTNGLKGEQQWADQMRLRVETQPPLTHNVQELKELIEPTMVSSV